MNIQELETLTGQPARNIRYLIAEGVVPPPIGTRRWAEYGEEHLLALGEYNAAKSEGVNALDVIRGRIRRAAGDTPATQATVFPIAPGVELRIEAGAVTDMAAFIRRAGELAADHKKGEEA